MRKLIYILIFFSFCCSAQQRIKNLNVLLNGASVTIKFTIVQGPQCTGYRISHSTDSVFFNEIYNYPGICGATADQDVSYVHTSPITNALNYYKVELFPVEISPVKRIYVSTVPKLTFTAYPNPVSDGYQVLNLQIYNANNAQLEGFVSNQLGKPIRQVFLTTQGDLTGLNVNDLSNGLYIIWLNDGVHIYSCKFIINR